MNYFKFILSIIIIFKYACATESGDIVEFVFDHNITYSSCHSHLPISRDIGALSTIPQSPQKSWNQKILFYTKRAIHEFTIEKILRKVIPGQDGRERISNTTEWPYSINTQLTIVFEGAEYGGSGSMVGPHHLLTCGHNVYDKEKNKWAEKILAYPALNDTMAPFSEVKVVKAYTYNSYIDPKNKNSADDDMALLLLDRSVGQYTGWGGLLSLDEKSLSQEKVNITGYPGDKGFTQMWTMKHILKKIMPQRFFYEIDTFGGQSGSPVWINKWGFPMIIGVHTAGSDLFNYGVRISDKRLKDLAEIISETYEFNNNLHKDSSHSSNQFDFDKWRSSLKKIDEPWARSIYKTWQSPDIEKISIHKAHLKEEYHINKKSEPVSIEVPNHGGGDRMAAAIAEPLKYSSSLKELHLANNGISEDGAREISNSLKSNYSLLFLDLMQNDLDNNGTSAIADALKVNSSLQGLGLGFNHIGNPGAIAIADTIKTNTSLRVLSMTWNNIEDEGIIEIADAVKKNSSLKNIDLRSNSYGEKGNNAIKEAREENPNIEINNSWCTIS